MGRPKESGEHVAAIAEVRWRDSEMLMPARLADYAANCFWLLVPILVLNAAWAKRLPLPYQPECFDRGIPTWLALAENVLRLPVFFLPLLMRLQIENPVERIGLVVYFAGLLSYVLSWRMQIRWPESRWSRSRPGFMAPAWTPAIWLAGIALVGQTNFLGILHGTLIYCTLAAGFLLCHNLHGWMVHTQQAAPHRSACVL
jgi:hypothetical protein